MTSLKKFKKTVKSVAEKYHMKTIYELVKEQRLKKGMTQKELAEKLPENIRDKDICLFEKNKRDFRYSEMKLIAEILGCEFKMQKIRKKQTVHIFDDGDLTLYEINLMAETLGCKWVLNEIKAK